MTNLIDLDVDRCIKKGFWWVIVPFLMVRIKICVGQMARDTGHNNITIPPWSPKVEVECVILGIRVTSISLIGGFSEPIIASEDFTYRLKGSP